MLARVERLEREVEMKSRRDRDDDRIDARVLDGRGVVRVAPGAAMIPAEGVRLGAIAARIAAGNLVPQGSQMPAVDAGDESAPEKSYS